MELFIDISAVLLGVIGLLGCILPVLPGPPLSYAGLVLLYFFGEAGRTEITGRFMIVWLVITVAVTVLDYIVPSWFTKVTGGSKGAARGSLAGMLIGILFFPPVGMIIGAFIGAVLGEVMLSGRKLGESFLPALGSFLGFVFGTGIKMVASGIMFYYIIKFL